MTPRPTFTRLRNLRTLIAAMQAAPMSRDQIGSLLGMGPSGVRKYLTDLRAMFAWATVNGEVACRWTASDDDTRAFLTKLNALATSPASHPRTALSVAERDPSRHFHILADDEHVAVRVSRFAPSRDPMALPAEFFARASAMEVRP